MKTWGVYLLLCKDGTYYCGITNNLSRRIAVHNAGKGAKYTKSRLPVKLLAFRGKLTHVQSLLLERTVKSVRKSEKMETLLYGWYKQAPERQ